MSWNDKLAGEDDPEVVQALRNFKACIDAWSDAAMSRPRTGKAGGRSWRLSAAWALGCAIALGALTGTVYERQHQQELTRVAAAKAAAQKVSQESVVLRQKLASQTNEDLLANVDVDISRAVPAAMEPLAQLMDEKQGDENGTE